MTSLKIGWTIPAPDGTRLIADAYLPDSPAIATVMIRTPYGRAAHRAEGAGWAARGFALVVQDVRGRYDSDGVWELYENERQDGAALVDAITAQPWSNGRVVASGGSYSGFTAWAAAVDRPQHVQAVISTGPSMGLHRVKWDRSGLLRLAEHTTWWLERADSRTSRDGAVAAALSADPQAMTHLPVRELPTRLGADLPGWASVIDAGPGARPADEVHDEELAAWPGAAMHVGGWHDLLAPDTLHHWHIVGSALPRRPPRRLVLGPWDHAFVWSATTSVGDRDYGPASRLPLGELQAEWLRAVLLDDADDDATRPQTSTAVVFEIGSGWERSPHWPPPADTLTLWPDAHGQLRDACPPPGRASFVHEPSDPYPSAGEATDRRRLTGRTDALRYCGPVLQHDLRLAGAPIAHLTGQADQPVSDWVVRLLEQRPDGTLLSLTCGAASPRPATVELDPVCVRLAAGSRLVLEITGADFPRLARNTGTTDRYDSAELRAVQQHLQLGPETRLELPIRAEALPHEEPSS